MNIFLIGYRCTGKSTVGRMLAETLGRSFVDADRELEEEHRTTITEMVAEHGWEHFRQKERETLVRLCEKDNQIIATGGGVILNPENVRTMKKSGTVIWLKADVEIVKSRILDDEKTKSQRPALTDRGLLNEIEEILSFRGPIYKNAADFSVDTDSISAEEICKVLAEKIMTGS